MKMPDEYRKLAAKWSKVFGVPLAVVLTIMERENGAFDPNAVNMGALSQGGAWGLMQITFTTATDDINSIKKSYPSNSDVQATLKKWNGLDSELTDPDLNIMAGTFHLRGIVREFGNSIETIFAAYNKGSGAVRKILAQQGHLGDYDLAYVGPALQIYRKYA